LKDLGETTQEKLVYFSMLFISLSILRYPHNALFINFKLNDYGNVNLVPALLGK
jgi:hypothetical protein